MVGQTPTPRRATPASFLGQHVNRNLVFVSTKDWPTQKKKAIMGRGEVHARQSHRPRHSLIHRPDPA